MLLLLLVVKIVAIARNPPHLYPPWYTLLIHTLLGMVSMFILHYRRAVFGWLLCVSNIGRPLNDKCCHSNHHPNNEKTSPIRSNPRAPSSSSISSSPSSLSSLPHTYLIVVFSNLHHHHHRLPRNHSSHGFLSKPSAYDIAHDVWMMRRQAD